MSEMSKEYRALREEITALVREYAQNKGKEMEEKESLPNCLIKEVVEMDARELTHFLTWLRRRYALVGKERVRKLLKEHSKENRGTDKGSREWFFYNGRLDLLKSLFPEIGKEAEG